MRILEAGYSGFQVLDCSLCQWNLDSGSKSFAGFRIPKLRILDSTRKNFLDSGIRSPFHEAKQAESNPVFTDTEGAIESVRFRGVSVLSEKRVTLFKSKRHPLLKQNTKEIIEELLLSSNYTSLTYGFVKKPSFRRLIPRKQ